MDVEESRQAAQMRDQLRSKVAVRLGPLGAEPEHTEDVPIGRHERPSSRSGLDDDRLADPGVQRRGKIQRTRKRHDARGGTSCLGDVVFPAWDQLGLASGLDSAGPLAAGAAESVGSGASDGAALPPVVLLLLHAPTSIAAPRIKM